MSIDGTSYIIAGVAAPQFYGDKLRSDPPDFWLPLVWEPNVDGGNRSAADALNGLYLVGRLGWRPRRGINQFRRGSPLRCSNGSWLQLTAEMPFLYDLDAIQFWRIRLMLAAREAFSNYKRTMRWHYACWRHFPRCCC